MVEVTKAPQARQENKAEHLNLAEQPNLGQRTREHVKNWLAENTAQKIRTTIDLAATAAIFAATFELNKFGADPLTIMDNIDAETFSKFFLPLAVGPVVDAAMGVLAAGADWFKKDNSFTQETYDHLAKTWGLTEAEKAKIDAQDYRNDIKIGHYIKVVVVKAIARNVLYQWGTAAALSGGVNLAHLIYEQVKLTPVEQAAHAVKSAEETIQNAIAPTVEVTATATATLTPTMTPTMVPTETMMPTATPTPEVVRNVPNWIEMSKNQVQGAAMWKVVRDVFSPDVMGPTAAITAGTGLVMKLREPAVKGVKWVVETSNAAIESTQEMWKGLTATVDTLLFGEPQTSPLKTEFMAKIPLSKEIVQKMNVSSEFKNYLMSKFELQGRELTEGNLGEIFLDLLMAAAVQYDEQDAFRLKEKMPLLGEQGAWKLLEWYYEDSTIDDLMQAVAEGSSAKEVFLAKTFLAAVAGYNQMAQEFNAALEKAQAKGQESVDYRNMFQLRAKEVANNLKMRSWPSQEDKPSLKRLAQK